MLLLRPRVHPEIRAIVGLLGSEMRGAIMRQIPNRVLTKEKCVW